MMEAMWNVNDQSCGQADLPGSSNARSLQPRRVDKLGDYTPTVRLPPHMAPFCAASLRPDLVARFPERGALDPVNRTTENHDAYTGRPFAPRVAQSTWKSEDAMAQITAEYGELAGAPLVTTDPTGGYETLQQATYKRPDLAHFVEVGTAKIPAPRDRFRGGYSASMDATFSIKPSALAEAAPVDELN